MNGMKRILLLLGLVLTAMSPSAAQTTTTAYVIKNGDYYLVHNEAGALNTTATTTFDRTTCFWVIDENYIRPADQSGTTLGGLYLRPRSGWNTYSLNTNNTTTYASWSGGLEDGGQPYYGSRYLRLNNNTTWQVGTTNSNRGTNTQTTI